MVTGIEFGRELREYDVLLPPVFADSEVRITALNWFPIPIVAAFGSYNPAFSPEMRTLLRMLWL
jgi:hypothetical protein